MRQAHADHAEAIRIRLLEQQEKRWRQAGRLSAHLTKASEHVEPMPDGAERTEAEAWLSGAMHYVRSIDPLTQTLRMPEVPESRHSDLEPFLHGWSAYGPYSR
ncbi:hypothetical protein ACH4TE_29820 [Streptomyces sioyaensis]|uniref:hypothetical protein n=1 Tax=Streptomyces sioyaensis TaxID=67364 RepID=UPI0037A5FAC8